MEKENQKKSNVKGHIRRVIDDHFNQSPKELLSNSMTTPKSIKKTYKIFWRPNNYRRQIEVKEKDNSTIQKIISAISAIPNAKISFSRHTKLLSIKNYRPNITIQYGKNTLTAIYSQNIIGGEKEVYLFEAYSIDDIHERITKKAVEIEDKIDKAISKFITRFRIKIPIKKPIWSRYEDFVKGIEYIDNIPREVIIHDTYFKKVYEKGIELKSSKKGEKPIVHLKNIIKNNAINDVAPEIAKELSVNREIIKGVLEVNASTSLVLNDFVTKFMPIQADFAVNIRSHTAVIKNMVRATNKLTRAISTRQKKLGDFI